MTASYMVSLAVADLLFVLVCAPYESVRYFIGHWSSGAALCKLSGLAEMLSALASVLNLIAVSVERYVLVNTVLFELFLPTYVPTRLFSATAGSSPPRRIAISVYAVHHVSMLHPSTVPGRLAISYVAFL